MANIKMEFINTYRPKGEIRISLRDKKGKIHCGAFLFTKNHVQLSAMKKSLPGAFGTALGR
jgi:hypothetical protein